MTDEQNVNAENEIKITDKRRFNDDGSVRADAQTDTVGAAVKPDNNPSCAQSDDTADNSQSLPKIDFSTFVLSLTTSAQVHLGLIPNPSDQAVHTDLPLAKQTIDILGVLEEKTKGNLEEHESQLLDKVLYDLRMMYLEKNK